MNYYRRHLGDYARDTAHLSMLEHGAYNLLLDRVYATEAGIPSDQAHRLVRARTKEERDAVDAVLKEFFQLCDGAWMQKRCSEEIDKVRVQIENARRNGRNGGRPRKGESTAQQKPSGFFGETQQQPSGFSLGSDSETRTKALQSPVSNLQSPPSREARYARGRGPRPTRIKPSEFEQKVIDTYHRLLPDHPKVKAWTEERRQLLEDRIADAQSRNMTDADTVAYWERFFARAGDADALCGRTSVNFFCSLAWLLIEENYLKVVEGWYPTRGNGQHGGAAYAR